MSLTHNAAVPPADPPRNRRQFLQSVGGAALIGASAPLWLPTFAAANPSAESAAERTVLKFHESLTPRVLPGRRSPRR
ncbi:MAG: hypothetical protein NT069_30005 [Planctomycetota bacterium]|nr:hypothetical protein [Planctomycetota bacterium]